MLKWKQDLLLLPLCLLMALVLNFPFIEEYIRFSDQSVFSFNDIDEPFYFHSAYAAAQNKANNSFYHESDFPLALKTNLTLFPNRITDYLVGSASLLINASIIELNLLLDILCTTLALFLLARFFYHFCKHRVTAFAAAIATAILPEWIFALYSIDSQIQWGDVFISLQTTPITSHQYPRLPIFRSIYTQLSLVWCYFILERMASYYFSQLQRTSAKLFYFGALVGSTFFIYFFGWVAAIITGLTMIISYEYGGTALLGQDHCRRILKSLTAFICGVALFSLPGMLILLQTGSFTSHRVINLGNYWFLPIEYISGILVLLLLLSKRSLVSQQRILLLAMLCLIVADLLFCNIQPLSNRELQPFHLARLYLYPLLTGLSIVFASSLTSHRWRIWVSSLSLSLLLTYAYILISQYREMLRGPLPLRARFIELLDWTKNNTRPDDVYALPQLVAISSTWQVSNIPQWVHILGHRPILFQMTGRHSDAHLVSEREREYLNHWLVEGTYGPYLPCSNDLTRPLDLFSSTRTIREMRRQADCILESNPHQSTDPLTLLQKYRVDYVLRDNQNESSRPDKLGITTNLVWASRDGTLALYKLRP